MLLGRQAGHKAPQQSQQTLVGQKNVKLHDGFSWWGFSCARARLAGRSYPTLAAVAGLAGETGICCAWVRVAQFAGQWFGQLTGYPCAGRSCWGVDVGITTDWLSTYRKLIIVLVCQFN